MLRASSFLSYIDIKVLPIFKAIGVQCSRTKVNKYSSGYLEVYWWSSDDLKDELLNINIVVKVFKTVHLIYNNQSDIRKDFQWFINSKSEDFLYKRHLGLVQPLAESRRCQWKLFRLKIINNVKIALFDYLFYSTPVSQFPT